MHRPLPSCRIPRLRAALTRGLLLVALLPLVAPVPVAAQGFASQSLGRGYWHMFIAYAIAWVVVMAWAVSIGRRLSEVERRIEE